MIIAEAGINHNGSINHAKKLADASKESGADAVKFQTFWGITRLKKYELSKEKWIQLKEHCDKIGIIFLSTPHTFEAIHFIDKLVPLHKVASTYLGNPNFLIEIARKKKPMLISTGNIIHNNGMATDDEIAHALRYISGVGPITLMHCVSQYPCHSAHYERIHDLEKFGYQVGLSDHTKTLTPPKTTHIEKHIMLGDIKCPDEAVSITPSEFKKMVDWLKSM
jgi:sialic acid synthase SpsE